jgi:hypothetical protein
MMKYAAALVCVVLLLSVVSAYAYEPVSVVERAALNSGMNQVACNDVNYDQRPIYFYGGDVSTMQTMKRWVRFESQDTSVADLGGEWSRTRQSKQTVDYVLYWVNQSHAVTITHTEYPDRRVPVKLYSRPGTEPTKSGHQAD